MKLRPLFVMLLFTGVSSSAFRNIKISNIDDVLNLIHEVESRAGYPENPDHPGFW